MQEICFNKHFVLILWFLFQLNFIYSQSEEQSFSKGVIIDTVFCLADSKQSYALYLPSAYDHNKEWPMLLVFDPAARGSLGASVFSSGAESFACIILCSNNSSNASVDGSFLAADAMIKDALSRFSVNKDRIYAAGFSGGSRFSLRLAMKSEQIGGVIGCGAGLPNSGKEFSISQRPFYYFGIVGKRDLNLQDMITAKNKLDNQGINTHLQIVEGGHQWPPEEELAHALAWLNIMNGESDDSLAQDYMRFRNRQRDEFLSENNILDAVHIMEALSDEFPFYTDSGKIESLKGGKVYKKQLKSRSAAYRKEAARRETYFNAFAIFNYSTPLRPDTVYTFQWWKREVHQLKKYEGSKNAETSMIGSRLLNMIEVQCAESLWNYVYMDQKDKALFTLELWLLVTPDKLWANWNAAKIYAVYENRRAALKYIEKIILSGETKRAWFRETPEFDSLRNDPGFSELMELVGKE